MRSLAELDHNLSEIVRMSSPVKEANIAYRPVISMLGPERNFRMSETLSMTSLIAYKMTPAISLPSSTKIGLVESSNVGGIQHSNR